MKTCGLILWNAVVIFEMSKTPWQMVKTPCERRFGKHSKARLFHLVQWPKIILISSTRTVKGSINLVIPVLLGIFLGYALSGGDKD